jgi:hypothetical protein
VTKNRKPIKRKRRRRERGVPSKGVGAVPVTAAELRALKRELEQRMEKPGKAPRGKGNPSPMRWNPEPEDVQRSVAQLVLTIVEFLRRLMERQAIRRMEQKTLSAKEIEAVGLALMRLEQTVREMGKRFGLTPEDLNLDLGPVGKLM